MRYTDLTRQRFVGGELSRGQRELASEWWVYTVNRDNRDFGMHSCLLGLASTGGPATLPSHATVAYHTLFEERPCRVSKPRSQKMVMGREHNPNGPGTPAPSQKYYD
jgi:hypothetical protein